MAGIDNTGGVRGFFNMNQTGGTTAKDGTGQGVGGGVNGQGGEVPPGTGTQFKIESMLANLFPQNQVTGDTRTKSLGKDDAATLKEFESALKTLLAAVRDPDMLSKLMVEMSSMSRQNALDARLNARSQARSELEGQAAETRESAQKMMISAIVGMVLAVVSAVISIAGAAKSISATKNTAGHVKDSIQANKIMDNAGDGLSDAGKMKLSHQAAGSEALGKISQAKADSMTQLTGALAGLSNAFKSMSEGILNSEAKKDEAQGQMLAAAAQDSQANADMAKQFMDELEEMIRTAIQFLKDMQQAETDMMATASRL